MFVKSIAAMVLFASYAAAANTTFDPTSIPTTTKSQWCQGQINTCGKLCLGASNDNTCNLDLLTYECTCRANNSEPGLKFYKESLPTFICEQVFQNCIKAGENDQTAQALCQKTEKENCGQLSPDSFTSTAITASPTSAPSSSGSAGAAATTTSSKAAAATLMAVRNFGTGAFAVGAAAAFGLML